MTTRFDSVAAVLGAVGMDLGATEWGVMTQERVNTFADATGDHQWIHVDPVRAATGPFGACVDHGYRPIGRIALERALLQLCASSRVLQYALRPRISR